MFKKLLTWLQARLTERSTLLGITAIATVAGVNVTPELQDTILQGAATVAGIIAVVTKDKLKK